MIKTALQSLVVAGFAAMAVQPAVAADTSKTQKTALTGRVFEYHVAGYHICVTFTGEDSLKWVYLAAPNDEAGKSATEKFDRRDIRPDVIMLAWTEESGANVTDVFDLNEMALHASFVTPNGKRFMSDAGLTERTGSCE
jgi:hypothetical protein